MKTTPIPHPPTLFRPFMLLLKTYLHHFVSTYDEVSNQTTYSVLPFGSVVMPGEWTKTNYNDVSNQQNFLSAESILGHCHKSGILLSVLQAASDVS